MWTIFCLPMGYIGYYIKKDKWWGYLILLPMILLTASSYNTYLTYFTFYYPNYLLISLFCIIVMFLYPNVLFSNKKVKLIGNIISGTLITINTFLNPYRYSTEILSEVNGKSITSEYQAYLKDSKYGEVSVKYIDSIGSYMLHADFKKNGKTKLIIITPDGRNVEYDLVIEMNKYEIDEVK